MTTATIDAGQGATLRSFYVPDFRIEAGTSESDLQPVHDVVRVSFTDRINEIDSFEFTVANATWAYERPTYTAHLPSAGGEPSLMPGARVRLWLGYVGDRTLHPMLTGRIVSVAPAFTAGDSGVTVTIRCLSTLEELREQPATKRWRPARGRSTITDVEVARQVVEPRDVELVVPSRLVERGHRTIAQTNETQVAFLIRRAKERGYVTCFRELPTDGPRTERLLFFGPSNLLGPDERRRLGDPVNPYELHWGTGLIDLRPNLNLSTTRWKSVKISFWDRRARRKRVIPYTIQELWDEEDGLNEDLAPIIEEAAVGEHELADRAVHSEDEARDLLKNTLRENFLDLMQAEGSTIGIPELRACSTLIATGIGAPFEGAWFVTSSTHVVDDSGYRTRFSARREHRTRSAV